MTDVVDRRSRGANGLTRGDEVERVSVGVVRCCRVVLGSCGLTDCENDLTAAAAVDCHWTKDRRYIPLALPSPVSFSPLPALSPLLLPPFSFSLALSSAHSSPPTNRSKEGSSGWSSRVGFLTAPCQTPRSRTTDSEGNEKTKALTGDGGQRRTLRGLKAIRKWTDERDALVGRRMTDP